MGQYVMIPIEWMEDITARLDSIQESLRAPAPADDKLLTPHEFAERLGVRYTTVCKWAREGELNCLRFGRKVFIPASELERRKTNES